LQRSPTQCNTVQHSATQCNTVQHSATQCNTLQDSATQCNILQHSATGAHDMMCATSTDELRQHARQKWREIFLRRECNNMRTWIETCEWVNETLCGSMRLNQSDTCTYICGSYTYEFWKQIRMNILIWKETCEWVNETLFDRCTYICSIYTYAFWKETCNITLIWKDTCKLVYETRHVISMHVYLRQLHMWILKRDM